MCMGALAPTLSSPVQASPAPLNVLHHPLQKEAEAEGGREGSPETPAAAGTTEKVVTEQE